MYIKIVKIHAMRIYKEYVNSFWRALPFYNLKS